MNFDPLAPIAFLFGAIVGSFLNVVIHRMPRGESLIRPASRCPACSTPIRIRHNVPIASYLFLRGKCAACRAPISMRYPFVEGLTGLLTLLVYLRFGPTPLGGAMFILAAGLVAVTFIDFDHRIIPDRLSLGGTVLGFILSFVTPIGWKASLIGLAAGGGSLFAVSVAYELIAKKEGMGMGDVKLIACIGAFLGWQAVLFTVFLSAVVGSLVGLLAIRLLKEGYDYQIPYGPFLALGAVVYMFAGPELIGWYLGFLPS